MTKNSRPPGLPGGLFLVLKFTKAMAMTVMTVG